jgi:hypothetical protein
MKKKIGEADFLFSLHLNFLSLNAWNPLHLYEMEDGHFIFIGDQSWPLIQAGKISLVGSKVSSWFVKLGY